MGLTVIEARRGCGHITSAGNGNHFGVMYAGVLFTAAEILGGIIAVASFDSSKFFPLVKGIDISFVGMAKSDVRAEARLDDATIDRVVREAEARRKSDFTLDAVVRDADKRRHHARAIPAARTRAR